MESHGVGGEIQVSEATYKVLKDKYILEQRGMIEIKGKGRLMTYWLQGKMNSMILY
jgi:urea transport system substrate-binding protein